MVSDNPVLQASAANPDGGGLKLRSKEFDKIVWNNFGCTKYAPKGSSTGCARSSPLPQYSVHYLSSTNLPTGSTILLGTNLVDQSEAEGARRTETMDGFGQSRLYDALGRIPPITSMSNLSLENFSYELST